MNDAVLWPVSMSYLACNLSRGSASISSAADNRRANCVFKALSPFNTSLSKELDTPFRELVAFGISHDNLSRPLGLHLGALAQTA